MKQIVNFVETVGKKVIFKFSGLIPNFEKGKEYVLEVNPITKDRSLEQNKMMWEIIQTISDITGQDTWTIYLNGLEHFFKKNHVRPEYIMAIPEAEDRLKRVYRAVYKVENRLYNGKNMSVFKCYYGSSHFSVREMTALIDYFTGLFYDLKEKG